MSRKYKFTNPEGIYFISFATVYWIDLFIREIYFDVLVQSLNYCVRSKGMGLFSWCIMPSHVHLIFHAKDKHPSELIKSFKVYTSKRLQELILNNMQESRKEWMLLMMEKTALKSSNGKNRQLWQQHNQPIELWSNHVKDQKVKYIHNNPVEAGFVKEPFHWKYSSAIDYAGQKGLVDIVYI